MFFFRQLVDSMQNQVQLIKWHSVIKWHLVVSVSPA